MNIENRMHDVVKLRCKACQDFIKMILKDNWKQMLYDMAEEANDKNSGYKAVYSAAYEQMRDYGVESYQVEKMDVTLIAALIIYNKFPGIEKVKKETQEAMHEVKNDRNLTNHSGENEEPDELYLRGLLSLCNLKKLVRTIDKYEVDIDKNTRLSYRQKYIKEIDELKDLLDEERIELIQIDKEIDKDIKRILESNNVRGTFVSVMTAYHKHYCNFDYFENGIFYRYDYFFVRASDAGIVYAHSMAADYFIRKLDYTEAERRLRMLYDAIIKGDCSVYEVLSLFNGILKKGLALTEGMNEMINGLRHKGFNIEKNQEGLYVLTK